MKLGTDLVYDTKLVRQMLERYAMNPVKVNYIADRKVWSILGLTYFDFVLTDAIQQYGFEIAYCGIYKQSNTVELGIRCR